MYNLIVAMDKNGCIGKNNNLPWHLPADLKHVSQTTKGGILVMGRKNHESIGRPLPLRHNVILTRDRNYRSEGCTVLHSKAEVLERFGPKHNVFIFGGAEIYKMFLPEVDTMHITRINHSFDGDVFFPEIDYSEWVIRDSVDYKADDINHWDYSISSYIRRL